MALAGAFLRDRYTRAQRKLRACGEDRDRPRRRNVDNGHGPARRAIGGGDGVTNKPTRLSDCHGRQEAIELGVGVDLLLNLGKRRQLRNLIRWDPGFSARPSKW
jgi:hypothetical protein